MPARLTASAGGFGESDVALAKVEAFALHLRLAAAPTLRPLA
jgi:hypothetical protein